MKRSFIIISVIPLIFFLLSPFLYLKGSESGKKLLSHLPSAGVKLSRKILIDPVAKARIGKVNKNKSRPANIIFKSGDGGQTWQDISEGLPEKLQKEGVQGDGFLASDNSLYLRAGNAVYHIDPNVTTSVWTREILPGRQRNITPGRNGILAYNVRGQFLKRVNGTATWKPLYKNFQEQAIRLSSMKDWMYTKYTERGVSAVFETAGGAVFVGSNGSIFKSVDRGKTWREAHVQGWIFKFIESEGVLLARNSFGILRSADDGDTWEQVINEGGEGIALEYIDGGFAAIVHNAVLKITRVYISLDKGKTWKSICEGLQPSWLNLSFKQISGLQSGSDILSIKQAGKYLICSRSDGIYRSSDIGKTWQLLLSSRENRGFQLSVSGNVIYAIPNKGC